MPKAKAMRQAWLRARGLAGAQHDAAQALSAMFRFRFVCQFPLTCGANLAGIARKLSTRCAILRTAQVLLCGCGC
jgi:hypothetical protein